MQNFTDFGAFIFINNSESLTMQSNTAFNTWFNEELGKGLVDIKLAVFSGKNITIEAVQDEILVAEGMLKINSTREAPSPRETDLSSAMEIFAKTTLQ